MTEKQLSTGTCYLCKGTFARAEMTRHLKSCGLKESPSHKPHPYARFPKSGIFRVFVEGRFQTAYWLHLDVSSQASFRHLDQFLRNIWLECCGHMSAFIIDDKHYLSTLTERSFPFRISRIEEFNMDVIIGKVFRPGMKFCHEYDFGTTTELALKIISYREENIEPKSVRLLARNNQPTIPCDVCGKKATVICSDCSWSGKGCLCGSCAKNHGCDKEMFLPVVNSPRTGVCGYTG